MYHVRKRNGDSVIFDLSKIQAAITKSFESCGRNYQDTIVEKLAMKAVARAEQRIKDNLLNVEDIQDSVESVLMSYGYEDVAKSYILYRKQHEKVRNAKDTVLDYRKTIEGYTNACDWRVKENASIDYSLGGLILNNSGAITANYWLSEIYDEEIANAHRNCDIHLHDLSMLSGYCFTGDTKVAVIEQEYERDYIDDAYIQNADGRIDRREFVSFDELVKSGRTNPYVIAHTGNDLDDQFEVVQAEDVRITRYVDTLIEITIKTLCYDEVKIKSTLDHPYMIYDANNKYSFVPASELKVGDHIVSLEFEIGGGYSDCGQQIKDIKVIKLDKEVPVYDLTVHKYHNFVIEGDIFVHNCAGWSLKTLIKEGFGGVPKKMSCRPAKHLSTICGQMVNYLGTMSLEWAGAQAFNSVDTLLAPFVKYEDLSYKEVRQCIQSLVNNLNISSRWGSQPVFSNFTFDWTVPDDLAELNCIVGGEEVDFKYKDCKREMDMINRAFLEVMIEGDADGKSFAYPIPTYSITKDFDWDTESINNKLLFEMTAKYGIPYFSNYINSDMEPSDVRSMCCRLRLSLKELRKKNGGYFGSGDNTGSIQVCTINLPRLAYKSKTEDEFYKNLEHLMDICARATDIKRKVLTQYLEQGLYPYTRRYLKSFDDHFSTIGIIGMNEACLNASWIRDNIASDSGYEFAKDVLDFMLNKLPDYQEKYGCLFNLEATPGESTTYRFASHDKKDFPDIITAGDATDGAPYYTNSSHLPVGYTDDIFTALDHQDDLQTKYTSGTVFHAFLGEKLPSWQSAMTLTRKIAENYKLPYFTFSPTYSICPEHGYIKGEEWTCPICGKTTEVYSRVTGYYRAVQNFNDGKAHEFKDRKEYVVNTDEVADEPDFECESCKVEYVDSSDTDTTYSDPVSSPETHKPMLFTTATCPNCKMAKKFISDAGFDCDNLLAEENTELVKQYNINSAPTLVVFENGQPRNIQNVSNIRKFLDSINK